jgi:L-lactate dehydrogenase (cytochrome)
MTPPERARRIAAAMRAVMRFEPIERDRVARRLRRAADVSDLRRIARRRLPRGVFDYVDGGAEDEITLNANIEAFRRIEFRPRVLRDMRDIDPSTTLLGKPLPIPLALAPTGFPRSVHPDGELATVRAAARAEVPYTLSTLGTYSIEDVAREAPTARKWFQVYVWRDRGLVKDMIERARAARYEALVVTVDTARFGRRERDHRRGFTMPPELGLGTLVDGALHPAWTWAFVNAEPIRFANVVGHAVGDGSDAVSVADYINAQFDPSLSWRDIDWMRGVWDGPIVLKGIQTVADAVLAAGAGVEAIALSNHGGRQLDTAPVPVELVEPVAQAVGDRVEIICDGGVRRGSDVLKAVALGARACMAGRLHLYGLGAGGERGVDHALEIIDRDVRRTMALLGASSIAEVTRELVA